MNDDYAVTVRDLGFPGGPTWLWTVRDKTGKLVDGGICGTQREAQAYAHLTVKAERGVEAEQPTGDGSSEEYRPRGEG